MRLERAGRPGGIGQLGGVWGEGLQTAPRSHHLEQKKKMKKKKMKKKKIKKKKTNKKKNKKFVRL